MATDHEGVGKRKRALVMAVELLDMAQHRWRRLNASQLLPGVRAGEERKEAA